MLSCKWCICTFVALLSVISPITTTTVLQNSKQTVSSQTIVVDQSGKGGFKTIQSAIDSIPSNNQEWTTININQGVYRERVRIPRDKPFIFLKGAGKETTFIVWNAEGDINNSATFTSEASNTLATLAKGITFTNSYNSPPKSNRNPMARALAARIQGDKSAFHLCGFFGLQDTLWDDSGRHYYKSCTIEGAVDFIFGAGQSLYESCIISVAAPDGGYITAQGRGVPEDKSGFVFNECNIVGNGRVYLGRPWRDYARVLFYKTVMSDVVAPQGWFASKVTGKEELSEYSCSGPGAESSKRVKWEKKVSDEEVKQLTSISFIDNEGWVNQAFNIMGV